MRTFAVFLAIVVATASAATAGRNNKLPQKDPSDHVHKCDIQAGEPCQPNDCYHCGYCFELNSHYFRCERNFPENPKLPVTGNWTHMSCDENLWWNPDLKPENATIGGACDLWDNLSASVKEGYLGDKTCVDIPPLCKWGQDTPCTAHYWFWDPITMAEGVREDMSCSDGLIWDPKTETCRESKNVEGC